MYQLPRATHKQMFPSISLKHKRRQRILTTRGSTPEGSGTVWDTTRFWVPFAFCHFFCSLSCNTPGTDCLVTCSLFWHWL